ncbi:hypothetical protein ES703_68798 [subsurface metagenome]
MRLEWMSSDDVRHFSVFIKQHIDNKVEPGHPRLFHEVLVQRISFQNASACFRMLYHLVAMVVVG